MTKQEMQERINALETENAIHRSKRSEVEIAFTEAEAFRETERVRWSRRERELLEDITHSKTVLRTFAVERWGNKADENLQYAVYGDGGGEVMLLELDSDRVFWGWFAAENVDIFRDAAKHTGLDVSVKCGSPTGERRTGWVYLFSRENDLSAFWREVETLLAAG